MRWALSWRAKALLFGSGTLLILLLLMLILAAWSLRQENNAQRAEIEPRIARLIGIERQHDKLKLSVFDADVEPLELVYPSTIDATMTGTVMQKNVRDALAKWGANVTGSKIRPVKSGDDVDQVSLEITAEVGIEALETVLLELPKLRPVVVIEELNIKAKTRRRANFPQVLLVRFRLTSLRLQS